jgi:hypothetical protein
MKACKMDRSMGSFIYKSQIFKSLSLMYHVSELPNSSESLLFSISVEIKEAEKRQGAGGGEQQQW